MQLIGKLWTDKIIAFQLKLFLIQSRLLMLRINLCPLTELMKHIDKILTNVFTSVRHDVKLSCMKENWLNFVLITCYDEADASI